MQSNINGCGTAPGNLVTISLSNCMQNLTKKKEKKRKTWEPPYPMWEQIEVRK